MSTESTTAYKIADATRAMVETINHLGLQLELAKDAVTDFRRLLATKDVRDAVAWKRTEHALRDEFRADEAESWLSTIDEMRCEADDDVVRAKLVEILRSAIEREVCRLVLVCEDVTHDSLDDRLALSVSVRTMQNMLYRLG